MTQPTPRDRPRKKGHALVLTSNIALVVGIVVALVGILASSAPVIVVGVAIVVVSIVVSLVNARQRRRRMRA